MDAMASQITSLTICLLNRLFRRRSKKTSKLRVTGLCAGKSLGTGEFPPQVASNAENVSIWWRHHVSLDTYYVFMWRVLIVIMHNSTSKSNIFIFHIEIKRNFGLRFKLHGGLFKHSNNTYKCPVFEFKFNMCIPNFKLNLSMSFFRCRKETVHHFLAMSSKVGWSNEHLTTAHYSDVIMSAMASQITGLAIVYSTVYSGENQRKDQISASLAFVRGIHRRQATEVPAQRASSAENVSIWWRHHEFPVQTKVSLGSELLCKLIKSISGCSYIFYSSDLRNYQCFAAGKLHPHFQSNSIDGIYNVLTWIPAI